MPTDENRRTNRETLRLAATYSEFNTLISQWGLYMVDNATRLQVSDEQVTALNAAVASWATAYNAYLDPNTRNRAAILAIENEYKADKEMIRGLQQQVKNNKQVALTGQDRMALAIHEDKETRTRVPVQTVAPLVTFYEVKHLENKARTSYPDSAGDFHRRLPAFNSLLIKAAYTTDGEPPADGAYTHVTSSGRSRFTIVSPADTAAGTIGFVKVAYLNSRGEMGPDSEPTKFVVI